MSKRQRPEEWNAADEELRNAILDQKVDLIAKLMEGRDPNARICDYKHTPLGISMAFTRVSSFKALLQLGCNPMLPIYELSEEKADKSYRYPIGWFVMGLTAPTGLDDALQYCSATHLRWILSKFLEERDSISQQFESHAQTWVTVLLTEQTELNRDGMRFLILVRRGHFAGLPRDLIQLIYVRYLTRHWLIGSAL